MSSSSLLDSSEVQRSKLPLWSVTYAIICSLLHLPIHVPSLVIACAWARLKALKFGNKRGDTPRKSLVGNAIFNP